MRTEEPPAAAAGIVVESAGLGIACDLPEWVDADEPRDLGVVVAGASRVPLLEVKMAIRGGEVADLDVHLLEARGDRAHVFRAVLPPLADGDVGELTLRARDRDREVVAPADGSGKPLVISLASNR